MFRQHSLASIVIRHTVQIANIFVIVHRKFEATPPYDCRRKGAVMVLQVCEQMFAATLHFHLWFLTN